MKPKTNAIKPTYRNQSSMLGCHDQRLQYANGIYTCTILLFKNDSLNQNDLTLIVSTCMYSKRVRKQNKSKSRKAVLWTIRLIYFQAVTNLWFTCIYRNAIVFNCLQHNDCLMHQTEHHFCTVDSYLLLDVVAVCSSFTANQFRGDFIY